jgi:hypothetical protein
VTEGVTITAVNPTWLYVGALYAIAVALPRRGGNPLPKRIAALFYALVLVFFFRPMTQHFVNLGTDFPQLMAPWSASARPGLTKYTVSNIETQDVVMQLVPWAHQVREAWRAGVLPLWNPLTGCGFPLVSNGQGAALSPLRLLALPLSLGNAMTAEGAFKVLIALTFTFLYCRRRGCSDASSVIGALAFGFGPFLIAWLHFAQATVACFLPAVMYQIDLLAERRTIGRFAAAAAMGPLVLFSGHPETVAHIFVFAALYVAWIVLVERMPGWRQFLAAIGGAGVVAVLLSLPFIVPFAEELTGSFRFNTVTTEWSREVPFSDFPSLALLVQPRLYGTRPLELAWGPATAESITGFAGILGPAAWFALVVDIARRRRFRSRDTWFVLASLFVFLVLANWHPAVAAVNVVLGLAANARLRFVFAWLMAVMIAIAVEQVRVRKEPWIAGLGFAGATLLYVMTKTNFPDPATRNASLKAMLPSIVVLTAAAILVLMRRFERSVLMALTLASIAEMWSVTNAWNPVRPERTLYPRTPLIDALLRMRGNEPYRAVGIDAVLFPNTNLLFGIDDVRVLDAMVPMRYIRLLHNAMPSYNTHEYYAKWHDAATPLLDRLNVRWVMTEPGRELSDTARFTLRYAGDDGRLYENLHVQPRFFATGARVRLVSASADAYALDVDATTPTLIVSSVGWSRWWRADSAAGRLRTQLVDGAFVGFVAPPGHTTVRVRYVPTSFYVSALLALITAAVLVCFMIRARVQRLMDLRRRPVRNRDRLRAPLGPGGP